jgi:hypothetical protein
MFSLLGFMGVGIRKPESSDQGCSTAHARKDLWAGLGAMPGTARAGRGDVTCPRFGQSGGGGSYDPQSLPLTTVPTALLPVTVKMQTRDIVSMQMCAKARRGPPPFRISPLGIPLIPDFTSS